MSLGEFNRVAKYFPISIVSKVPELPYRITVNYGIGGYSGAELGEKYRGKFPHGLNRWRQR